MPRLTSTFLFSLLLAGTLAAQDRAPELGPGRLLIASRDLRDPNFAQAVVLILQYGEDGAIGAIINRPADMTVASALPDMKEAHDRSDPAFAAGPVDQNGAFALVRADAQPDQSRAVLRGVYLITDESSLAKILASSPDASTFRLYLGYTGWSAGQLDHEVDLGAWNVLNGTPDLLFDSDPGTLWTRLVKTAELRIARRNAPARPGGSLVRVSHLARAFSPVRISR